MISLAVSSRLPRVSEDQAAAGGPLGEYGVKAAPGLFLVVWFMRFLFPHSSTLSAGALLVRILARTMRRPFCGGFSLWEEFEDLRDD